MGIISKKTLYSQCFLLPFFLSLTIHFSKGSDTISPGQSLSGNQTLTSINGTFELGFFTPGNSQNYYIGIWYKIIPNRTVVWVANRKQPVSDPASSSLKVLEDGNLVLLNKTGDAIWSTNSTANVSNSTTARLLDNGNFVVRNAGVLLWQSFDHPTDHWLPGVKLGYNKLRNYKQNLVSWRSYQNPAPSLFSVEVAQKGNRHLLLWNGTREYWTSGEWTGKIFTLVPEIQANFYVRNITYISNANESYFTYESAIPNAYTRFLLDVTGQLKQYVWQKNFGGWRLFWTRPTQQCEVYAFCGPFSVCNQQDTPLCACMEGFEPKTAKDWGLDDHTDGCVRKVPLKCDVRGGGGGGNDTFLVMPKTQFPVNSESLAVDSIEECQSACLNNCSCNAFAYDDGCLIWKGDILNLQKLVSTDETGKDFHLRTAASDLIETTTVKPKRVKRLKTTWIVFATIVSFFTLCAFVLVIILWRRRSAGSSEAVDDSLVLFKYRDLKSATKNFSEKLGEGGFGSVFRGTLPDSTGIAVKELKSLQQGEKQFRAEVKTIGTVQHINLVRLRGICVESSKRFLVYEYMPNGSLESVLFGKTAKILDWQSRYKITIGTGRGLAYLHEKCRDCIIHCDIKPENILLDAEYNAKVADFGLAKLIGRDFSRVLTTMRGTRGYLAPEWISGEAVTPKADVFSYGMMLFEIISGRRNREQLDYGLGDYFPLRVANAVYNEENVLALLDDRLEGNAIIEELNRACKVACWCIQGDEKDRPTMGQVVQILEGVSEVSAPPIPHFLQRLAENPSKTVDEQDSTSSTSGFWA